MLIPFFAFALGMGIDFGKIIEGGLSGVMLGVAATLITGTADYSYLKHSNGIQLLGRQKVLRQVML